MLFDNSMMLLRRHKGLLQIVGLIFLLGLFVRYFYNNHQDTAMRLKAANVRHHELLEERNKLKRELEVLSESKSNIEYSLMQKKTEVIKFKNECKAANDELVNQGNKFRSQSLARFNALDSEYQMVKANKEDLETDHKHLQQSFDRLKAEHSKIKTTYEENVKELKIKNENVISALERQIEYYQKKLSEIDQKPEGMKNKGRLQTIGKKSQDTEHRIERETGNTDSRQETVEKLIAKKKKSLNRRGDRIDSLNSRTAKDSNELQPEVENNPKNDEVVKREIANDETREAGNSKGNEQEDMSDKELRDYKAKRFDEDKGKLDESLETDVNDGANERGEVFNGDEGIKQLNNDQKFADNDRDSQEENDENAGEEDDEEVKDLDEEKLLGNNAAV